jgi:hemolysin D
VSPSAEKVNKIRPWDGAKSKKGRSGTINRFGKRRIIEFFIYPLVKYLDEGISVR